MGQVSVLSAFKLVEIGQYDTISGATFQTSPKRKFEKFGTPSRSRWEIVGLMETGDQWSSQSLLITKMDVMGTFITINHSVV